MSTIHFEFDHPKNDAAALERAIANKLIYSVGKDPSAARPADWQHAVMLAVRDRLIERWMKSTRTQYTNDVRRVYYLSMEFLTGRAMSNAVLALEMMPGIKAALRNMGVDYDVIANLEPDAALGNGGLGRLAACFLDSMATLGLPGYGYGIRYDYGMFRQQIVDGNQQEAPDYWLANGNVWEFPRPEVQYRVRFGGRIIESGGKVDWVDTHDVLAMAYDTIVPGYATEAINTLRLWSAKATSEINLDKFNRGDYFAAVDDKNHSENVSRVLYPDDSTQTGRELRLRQEYFFCSASLQDLIRRYLVNHDNFIDFVDKVAIHLNDTHPVLAIPEMMRLLVDEHNQSWAAAWGMTQQIFSYTNHTLMSEALETWPVDMLGRILPRHLKIIFDLNATFLSQVTSQIGHDTELMRRVSLVDESGERRVRMAYVAVVASHSINGVSALHSELMKESIFADFAKLFPERFNNKTNGITPRRWLAQANPMLSDLIDTKLPRTWRRHLDELKGLLEFEKDPAFMDALMAAKAHNKARLCAWVETNMGIRLNPNSLFDIQVKRIHEYKRQLLNVLHVITRYQRILAEPDADWVPRTVVFAGKAASAYRMAKLIIKLINDVSKTINNDPRVKDKLKVVFIPNYSVSLAEIIIPAADLSEQISLAGTEASGTGNMKFALNGALTIGTEDGANIEIGEAVGPDNIFIFGNDAAQAQQLRQTGYQPRALYEGDAELKAVLDAIGDGTFSPDEPGRFGDIYNVLVNWGDYYQLLADYGSYIEAQERVDSAYRDARGWVNKSLHNIANMGSFSSDRTIAEYAKDIWHVESIYK